jgi:imidazole glycerol phosphate synthase subunit HisF
MLNQSSAISKEQVIQQATVWGFNCQVLSVDECRIYPHSRSDDWHLQGQGDSWLLAVSGIPQMEMSSEMTLRFLTRQYFQMRSQRTLALCT